jgi:hypothetical protein
MWPLLPFVGEDEIEPDVEDVREVAEAILLEVSPEVKRAIDEMEPSH